MTKVIVLGETQGAEPKKIKFKTVMEPPEHTAANCTPEEYENIVLISRNYYGSDLDLMFAYDEDPNMGCLYLGYFNDGVV